MKPVYQLGDEVFLVRHLPAERCVICLNEGILVSPFGEWPCDCRNFPSMHYGFLNDVEWSVSNHARVIGMIACDDYIKYDVVRENEKNNTRYYEGQLFPTHEEAKSFCDEMNQRTKKAMLESLG